MDVTELLRKAGAGDPQARQDLMPLVYGELKRLAAAHLRGQWNITLGATALVHEAYLRLAGPHPPAFEDRAHFFGIASRLMRNVLVDLVRHARAEKRGAGLTLQLDAEEAAAGPAESDVELLDAALEELAAAYPRPAEIIEMRYFGGMTAAEIAVSLNLSEATIQRDARFARAWLRRALAGPAKQK